MDGGGDATGGVGPPACVGTKRRDPRERIRLAGFALAERYLAPAGAQDLDGRAGSVATRRVEEEQLADDGR